MQFALHALVLLHGFPKLVECEHLSAIVIVTAIAVVTIVEKILCPWCLRTCWLSLVPPQSHLLLLLLCRAAAAAPTFVNDHSNGGKNIFGCINGFGSSLVGCFSGSLSSSNNSAFSGAGSSVGRFDSSMSMELLLWMHTSTAAVVVISSSNFVSFVIKWKWKRLMRNGLCFVLSILVWEAWLELDLFEPLKVVQDKV